MSKMDIIGYCIVLTGLIIFNTIDHMKIILSLLLSLVFYSLVGQSISNRQLLDSAKRLFNYQPSTDEYDYKTDYQKIADILEQINKTDPNNTEIKYYLGYCYSRINSNDASSIINMDLDLLYKTSQQFETITKYDGEMVLLDPYSKIASEWASMALSYMYHNKIDSAIWAYNEGKKRGGFSDFMLEVNRQILDACSPNSILISSGDNISFTLMYLQNVENYRPDISLVEISLLNTEWYPRYLSKNKNISFDAPISVIDTINYKYWTDSVVKINNFKWTIKPSYYENYLLRGDLMLLSLLKANDMQRDIYFTFGAKDENKLSLLAYLKPLILVEKLSPTDINSLSFEEFTTIITSILKSAYKINQNSTDDYLMLDYFRDDVFKKADDFLEKGDKIKAQKLLTLLDRYVDHKKYPYSSDRMLKLDSSLRKELTH